MSVDWKYVGGTTTCKHKPIWGAWVCRKCSAKCFPDYGSLDPAVTIEHYCDKWIPAVQHSSDWRVRLTVEITQPFEAFGAHEMWEVAYRVRFEAVPAPEVEGGRALSTPCDALKGWQSAWLGHWWQIDRATEEELLRRTGHKWSWGWDMYKEMAEVVTHGDPKAAAAREEQEP